MFILTEPGLVRLTKMLLVSFILFELNVLLSGGFWGKKKTVSGETAKISVFHAGDSVGILFIMSPLT